MVDIGAMAWCIVSNTPSTVLSSIASIWASNVSATWLLAGVLVPTEEAEEFLHWVSWFSCIVVFILLFLYLGFLLLRWLIVMRCTMTSMLSMVMWWWLVFLHDIYSWSHLVSTEQTKKNKDSCEDVTALHHSLGVPRVLLSSWLEASFANS